MPCPANMLGYIRATSAHARAGKKTGRIARIASHPLNCRRQLPLACSETPWPPPLAFFALETHFASVPRLFSPDKRSKDGDQAGDDLFVARNQELLVGFPAGQAALAGRLF